MEIICIRADYSCKLLCFLVLQKNGTSTDGDLIFHGKLKFFPVDSRISLFSLLNRAIICLGTVAKNDVTVTWYCHSASAHLEDVVLCSGKQSKKPQWFHHFSISVYLTTRLRNNNGSNHLLGSLSKILYKSPKNISPAKL